MISLVLLSMGLGQLPAPSERQLAWHGLDYYAFCHFGPNTFTDKEWGEGREDPLIFNPTRLDCRQWARVFRQAGMKAVVITAKHHDGFCLWPSKLSSHTVAQSAWKDGKGDVLKELAAACKAEGLKMGVYLSPWDRNHPTYGTPEYNRVFARMLEEVLTQYGPIFEVWFDGANGEGPNGKRQVYDWDLFIRTVRKHQPGAVIFSDAGPDVRWVGNEQGIAGETNWNTITREGIVIGAADQKYLNIGDPNGAVYVPAECDVSIRPGWFYHASEDDQVKSVETLLDIWHKSVGRGANLLLNVPPDRRGLIHERDVAALVGMRRRLDVLYGTDLVTTWSMKPWRMSGSSNVMASGTIEIGLHPGKLIDRIVLGEDLRHGQRVEHFVVTARIDDRSLRELARGTTIGNRRIILLSEPCSIEALAVALHTRGMLEPKISLVRAFGPKEE